MLGRGMGLSIGELTSRTKLPTIATDQEIRGLSTFGGFIETKYLQPAPTTGPLPYPQSQTIMTFGHNGFLGYTPCTTASSASITSSHIRGDSAVPRGEMGFWWARSAHEDPKVEPDLDVAKEDLRKRMAKWRDPNVKAILDHGIKTAMIPTYALSRQRTWAGRRVVLVGDAAHGKWPVRCECLLSRRLMWRSLADVERTGRLAISRGCRSPGNAFIS